MYQLNIYKKKTEYIFFPDDQTDGDSSTAVAVLIERYFNTALVNFYYLQFEPSYRSILGRTRFRETEIRSRHSRHVRRISCTRHGPIVQ